jgi:hypothetical protein
MHTAPEITNSKSSTYLIGVAALSGRIQHRRLLLVTPFRLSCLRVLRGLCDRWHGQGHGSGYLHRSGRGQRSCNHSSGVGRIDRGGSHAMFTVASFAASGVPRSPSPPSPHRPRRLPVSRSLSPPLSPSRPSSHRYSSSLRRPQAT